jgi:hypothetical protein
MNIRPVNSEQAYDEAIERIEMRWGMYTVQKVNAL